MSLAALELHGSVHWKETGFEVAIFSKRTRKQYDLTVDQAYLDKMGTRFDVKGSGKMLESMFLDKVPEALTVEAGFVPPIDDSKEGQKTEKRTPTDLSDTPNGDSDSLEIRMVLQTEFADIRFRYVLSAKSSSDEMQVLRDRISFLEHAFDAMQIENKEPKSQLQSLTPPKTKWKTYGNLDSYGGDICHLPGVSVGDLELICKRIGGVAFNENGWIKAVVKPENKLQHFPGSHIHVLVSEEE
eukprot:266386_1